MDANNRPQMSRELLERLTNDRSYAQATPIGTTLTVAPRRQFSDVNCNRQFVGNYRSSHLANQSDMRRSNIRRPGMEISRGPRTARLGSNISRADKPGARPLRQIDSGVNRPSAGFQEPPARKYNPFA